MESLASTLRYSATRSSTEERSKQNAPKPAYGTMSAMVGATVPRDPLLMKSTATAEVACESLATP